eukprot:11168127-Lingulodinium_polyedra.AAC.1
MANMSAFQTTLLGEVADCLQADGGGVLPAEMDTLCQFARLLFSGWGQTKVCEDANQVVRESESRSVRNRVLNITKQWDVMRTKAVISQHGRTELDPSPGQPGFPLHPQPLPAGLYWAKPHTWSVPDEPLTLRRSWPSFTAQGAQGLAAQQ